MKLMYRYYDERQGWSDTLLLHSSFQNDTYRHLPVSLVYAGNGNFIALW